MSHYSRIKRKRKCHPIAYRIEGARIRGEL